MSIKRLGPQAHTARATRSNPASTQFKIVKCKTAVKFQKPFFNRSTRLWNTLVHNVDNFISSDLSSFRNALLSAVYHPEDPRTWKTICLTCNTTHTHVSFYNVLISGSAVMGLCCCGYPASTSLSSLFFLDMGKANKIKNKIKWFRLNRD